MWLNSVFNKSASFSATQILSSLDADAPLYEEMNLVELEDADGNVMKYLHIATLPYKGQNYCCFQIAEPEDEDEEDEIIIFRAEGEGENLRLLPVEDDALLDEVFAEFCAQYEQQEYADDARRLDE